MKVVVVLVSIVATASIRASEPEGTREPPVSRRIEAGSVRASSTQGFGEPVSQLGDVLVVARPFVMKTTEVTQAEWRTVIGDGPSHKDCADCPVESVNWDDVAVYLNTLSRMDGLEPCYREADSSQEIEGLDRVMMTGDGVTRSAAEVLGSEATNKYRVFVGLQCTGYRLPTRGEWLLAARLEEVESAADLERLAWHSRNAGGASHPVGQRAANGNGLYDMVGNVREWVHAGRDFGLHDEMCAVVDEDPSEAIDGMDRVVLGASFASAGLWWTVTSDVPALYSCQDIGLRWVRSVAE